MKLNLRQLQSFTVLARARSFTRAAEALHLSQPALTVQIRSLEETLGSRLFDRNTREVRLTSVGRDLLPAFERLLRDMDSVAQSARELAAGIRGVVHVAALPSACATLLPAVIGELRRRHPGIVVRLRDAVAQRVLALVRDEEVDLGIGGFDRVDADMELTPLFSDRIVAVMRKGHPLAKRLRLALADLREVPLILMDTQSSVRALVEQAWHGSGRVLTPAYEVTYMTTAVGLAQAGEGVALIPETALELRMASGVAVRPLAGRSLERRIALVRKPRRTSSPAAEGFVEVLKAATPARAWRATPAPAPSRSARVLPASRSR
jgi:DNA-binding transcriptional LysR family regulator